MYKKRIAIVSIVSMICVACGCGSDNTAVYQKYIDGGRVDTNLTNLIQETNELINSNVIEVKRNKYMIEESNTDKIEVYDSADAELYNSNGVKITLNSLKWNKIDEDNAIVLDVNNDTRDGLRLKVKYIKLNDYTVGSNGSCKIDKYRNGQLNIKVDKETLGAMRRDTDKEEIIRFTAVLEIKDSKKNKIDGYAEFMVAREGMYEIDSGEGNGLDSSDTAITPELVETPTTTLDSVDSSNCEVASDDKWVNSKEVWNKDGIIVKEEYTSKSDKEGSGWKGRRIEFKVQNNSNRNIKVAKAKLSIGGSKVNGTLKYSACMNDSTLVSCVSISKEQLKKAKIKGKKLSDIKVVLELTDADTGEQIGICETGIFNE